jgi:hypothetical protein
MLFDVTATVPCLMVSERLLLPLVPQDIVLMRPKLVFVVVHPDGRLFDPSKDQYSSIEETESPEEL